jgi:hypothetical protein
MKMSIRLLLATGAAAALAACNGNGGIFGPSQPTPPPNCNGPAKNMEVLYPRPGAGHVPPTVSAVYVSTDAPLPAGNSFDLFASLAPSGNTEYTVNRAGQPYTGSGSGFFTVSASQIPQPHATPTYPNPTYYATLFQNGPIGPSTTVSLLWNDAGTGCNPNVVMSLFTTAASGLQAGAGRSAGRE